MVPSEEFKRLTDYYKGELTENALLNKAARLTATKHVLTRDKRIPAGIAVQRIKPIAKEVARLTKRIRHGPVRAAPGAPTDEDDDSLLNTPLENLLKQLVKKEKPAAAPTPAPIKKEPMTEKQLVKKEAPSTSGTKKSFKWDSPAPPASKVKRPSPAAPPSEAERVAEEIREHLFPPARENDPRRPGKPRQND